MKKFFALLALASIGACSDDNPTPYVAPVTGESVPSKVTVIDNADNSVIATYTFTYDGEHRIQKLTKTGDSNRQYLFTYTADDQVETVSITGDDPGLVALTYDNFLRPTSMAVSGQLVPITFDVPTETYHLSNFTFKLNESGDLTNYQTLSMQYSVDAAQKSPFQNVHSSYQLVSLFNDSMLLHMSGKRPIEKWVLTTNNTPYAVFISSYNSEGFVSEAIVSGMSNVTYKFEYTNLL